MTDFSDDTQGGTSADDDLQTAIDNSNIDYGSSDTTEVKLDDGSTIIYDLESGEILEFLDKDGRSIAGLDTPNAPGGPGGGVQVADKSFFDTLKSYLPKKEGGGVDWAKVVGYAGLTAGTVAGLKNIFDNANKPPPTSGYQYGIPELTFNRARVNMSDPERRPGSAQGMNFTGGVYSKPEDSAGIMTILNKQAEELRDTRPPTETRTTGSGYGQFGGVNGTPTDPQAVVRGWYAAAGREGDQEGINYWADQIRQNGRGATEAQFNKSFASVVDAKNAGGANKYDSLLNQLYTAPGQLDSQAQKVYDAGKTGIAALADSHPAVSSRVPGLQTRLNEDGYITTQSAPVNSSAPIAGDTSGRNGFSQEGNYLKVDPTTGLVNIYSKDGTHLTNSGNIQGGLADGSEIQNVLRPDELARWGISKEAAAAVYKPYVNQHTYNQILGTPGGDQGIAALPGVDKPISGPPGVSGPGGVAGLESRMTPWYREQLDKIRATGNTGIDQPLTKEQIEAMPPDPQRPGEAPMDMRYRGNDGKQNVMPIPDRMMTPPQARKPTPAEEAELIRKQIEFDATGQNNYAAGGIAQAFAKGGPTKPRYLRGETDGMADQIKARIDGGQEARLAHGEFVIPADVVSHLGNGNSDAGAKKLYSMMDKIRVARTGNKKQGKQINPDKFLPVKTGGIKALAAGGKVARFNDGGYMGGEYDVDYGAAPAASWDTGDSGITAALPPPPPNTVTQTAAAPVVSGAVTNAAGTAIPDYAIGVGTPVPTSAGMNYANSLYSGAGRTGDSEGLNYWASEYDKNGADATKNQFSKSFATVINNNANDIYGATQRDNWHNPALDPYLNQLTTNTGHLDAQAQAVYDAGMSQLPPPPGGGTTRTAAANWNDPDIQAAARELYSAMQQMVLNGNEQGAKDLYKQKQAAFGFTDAQFSGVAKGAGGVSYTAPQINSWKGGQTSVTTTPTPNNTGGNPAGRQDAQSPLATWAGQYVTNMLGEGQAIAADMTRNPQNYIYQGPRTAGASALQTQAFNAAGGLKDNETLKAAGDQALGTAGKIGDLKYTSGLKDFTGENVDKYMNPYLMGALNPQIEEARRQAEITRMQNAGRLVGSGAFGGGRQAIMEAEGDRNLHTGIQGIVGKGYDEAFKNAQNQFNLQENRNMADNQFGAKYGLDALTGSLNATKTAGDLASAYGADTRANINTQSQQGGIQRLIEQEGLTADMNKFNEEAALPGQAVKFKAGLLNGMPISNTAPVQQQTSMMTQLMQLGLTASQIANLLGGGNK
jgi:hypothetical protein